MKLKKAKTCNNCKALYFAQGYPPFRCELNYPQDYKEGCSPVEQCPKPLNYKDFYEALENWKHKRNVCNDFKEETK